MLKPGNNTLQRPPDSRAGQLSLPALIGLFALLASMALGFGVPTARAASSTTIAVDGTSSGRTFDGIGAISGGGGNSRLLTDYPTAQQQQILDYLFKPGYGANLQIFKTEIGGDMDSTDGSESSIEHSKGVIDCNAGYEWWLMNEAKKRNPAIKLYGLPWGAPGWIGNSEADYWNSTDAVNYLVSWLDCAKSKGLTIDYIGGRNEKGYNADFYKRERAALDAAGYGAVKLIVADDNWNVADAVATDPDLAKAVSIIGTHYPCEGGAPDGNANSCPVPSTATATGKTLWASENGSQDFNSGAGQLIRSITRGYVDGGLTSYINWPVLGALYSNLDFATTGLIQANQPSSGAYEIGKNTWATAQVTQFTAPGWKFLDKGSGYLGGTRANGSYVTLKSTNNTDYSTVIETTTATEAQNVTLNVSGGLSNGTVHVWSTNLNSDDPADHMAQAADITPVGGSYSLTAQPGRIYTVTTTTGQGKGTATSPAQSTLKLPYSDTFDGDTFGQQPPYLSQMQGAFEVTGCAGGRSGRCLTQQTPVNPINANYTPAVPYTIGGSLNWTNYTVAADTLIRQPGSIRLIGRAGTQARFQAAPMNEYYLDVSDTGDWSIVRNNFRGTSTTLASGKAAALGTTAWHHLALTLNGPTLTAVIDGTTVGSATDATYRTGLAGLGTAGYQTNQFDNFTVSPVGTQPSATGPVTALADTAKCMDLDQGHTTDGTPVQMWDCNGGNAQNWTTQSDGTIRINGKCLDITGSASTQDGALVELWTCNGGPNQQWQPHLGGTLINPASGKCLDDPAGNTANGTQLVIWTCNGNSNQRWVVNLP